LVLYGLLRMRTVRTRQALPRFAVVQGPRVKQGPPGWRSYCCFPRYSQIHASTLKVWVASLFSRPCLSIFFFIKRSMGHPWMHPPALMTQALELGETPMFKNQAYQCGQHFSIFLFKKRERNLEKGIIGCWLPVPLCWTNITDYLALFKI